MNEFLVGIFAVVAAGCIGIGAWQNVQFFRMRAALTKVDMEALERAANYAETKEANIERRIAVINETRVKQDERPERPRPQVQKIGDDPDSYQDEPRFVDELRAEQYESENHPNDRFRRDLPSDGMPIQR